MRKNYKRDRIGRFSRKQKINLWAIGIILTSLTLASAVVGVQDIYGNLSQRAKDVFKPKVIEVTAETPEPTDMKECA